MVWRAIQIKHLRDRQRGLVTVDQVAYVDLISLSLNRGDPGNLPVPIAICQFRPAMAVTQRHTSRWSPGKQQNVLA